jgi:hypothetical protein
MDILRTNGNPVKLWSERAKPADATQTSARGVAYEYLFALANRTGKDLWINVPDQAGPEYFAALADLAASLLNPDRKLYLEYSNETWNSMFAQHERNISAAQQEQAAGVANYDWKPESAGNRWYMAWRRNGEMCVRIAQAMRPKLGDRLRVVLCAQVGWGAGDLHFIEQYKEALDYIQRFHGEPAAILWAIGSGTYVSLLKADQGNASLTPEQVLDSIKADATWVQDATLSLAQLAADYRLPGGHVAYEGGLDIAYQLTPEQRATREKLIAQGATVYPFSGWDRVHYLPAMRTFLADFFRGSWFGASGRLFCWYSLIGIFGEYSWGVVEAPTDPLTLP